MRRWLLGATFLGVQIYEYYAVDRPEGFTPSGSLFGGGFYTVTGFHGFHVFIGLIWCAWLIRQAFQGKFSPTNYMRIEIFGLYWHFVDIVWIILFTIIYLDAKAGKMSEHDQAAAELGQPVPHDVPTDTAHSTIRDTCWSFSRWPC